jgi:hypothetical protein
LKRWWLAAAVVQVGSKVAAGVLAASGNSSAATQLRSQAQRTMRSRSVLVVLEVFLALALRAALLADRPLFLRLLRLAAVAAERLAQMD